MPDHIDNSETPLPAYLFRVYPTRNLRQLLFG